MILPGEKIEISWEDAELVQYSDFCTIDEILDGYSLPVITQIGYFLTQNNKMFILAFEKKDGKYRDYACIPASMIRSVKTISAEESLSPTP